MCFVVNTLCCYRTPTTSEPFCFYFLESLLYYFSDSCASHSSESILSSPCCLSFSNCLLFLCSCSFVTVKAFDLQTSSWSTLKTYGKPPVNLFPWEIISLCTSACATTPLSTGKHLVKPKKEIISVVYNCFLDITSPF